MWKMEQNRSRLYPHLAAKCLKTINLKIENTPLLQRGIR
jgi:hypothetical protein